MKFKQILYPLLLASTIGCASTQIKPTMPKITPYQYFIIDGIARAENMQVKNTSCIYERGDITPKYSRNFNKILNESDLNSNGTLEDSELTTKIMQLCKEKSLK